MDFIVLPVFRLMSVSVITDNDWHTVFDIPLTLRYKHYANNVLFCLKEKFKNMVSNTDNLISLINNGQSSNGFFSFMVYIGQFIGYI